jgi:hypothetical protein
MRPAFLGRLAALLAVAALAIPATAAANEVTTWNAIAQNTVLAQPPIASAPPAAAVFMAMVQGSVYGAVNAIDGVHRPYLIHHASRRASKEAAVAAAAFRVLDTLFPAQHDALKAQYDASLAAIPDGSSKEAGIKVGTDAADALLAQGHDGRSPLPCVFGNGPGVWRPLLAANGTPMCDPTPWVASARPFLVKSAWQFLTEGPNALTSRAYARDVNEVEELGALNSTSRTAAETHAAAFWQTNPAATWNGVARRLADDPVRPLDISDSARLFGMMDLSAADALINCWNDKYSRSYWRPITAIREADTDGNPATVADPTWQPLFDPSLDPLTAGAGPALVTPPYPEHPSGANCFTWSSLTAVQAFLGTDRLSFYVTSSRFPAEQRHFDRLSDAGEEVIEARIWAGIHFRTADEQGAELGRRVARWDRVHYFMPLH